jgi:hypothetical protein
MPNYRQPFKGDYPISLNFHEEWLPTYDNIKTFHTGTDYACPMNTPILASADGTVMTVAEAVNGYGKYIILCHYDGSGTVYAHLDRISVKQWQSVKQGDVIGYSGNTGNSSGPHLHFEWRRKANDITTAEDARTHLTSVLDDYPIGYSPEPKKPEFATVQSGFCKVVCDYANVRCHCDMNRVVGVRKKGDVIAIGDEVTWFNGLPYRDFYDADYKCWLRIAEHDPDTQIIENTEL